MKFLADMGISQGGVLWLREQGHDAIRLREQRLRRLSDPEIARPDSLPRRSRPV
ncbi:MAG: DUF5615 family PIN-like protein [Candidatus Wallbacteria bacterium]|nr:DUF5615 family PIN-like protein [Candidatus Wallbacteria bacterium]